MKKIFDGLEVVNILVGEMDCLKYQIIVFVRLIEVWFIGDLMEVFLLIKFIFFFFGFFGSYNKNVEMGCFMFIMMVDEVFVIF